MPSRSTASDYSPDDLLLVRQTCLYLFSDLPPGLTDSITVVGGLVPSLLIPQPAVQERRHLGTADLDVGLALGLRGEMEYEALTAALTALRFQPERIEDGRPTSMRWQLDPTVAPHVLIDILPVAEQEATSPAIGRIPGIELSERTQFAFRDREKVEISGTCLAGRERRVSIWVCGPGSYIVIKALMFEQRQFSKDAYDLFYVLRNYGTGVHEVASRLAPLLHGSTQAARAIEILQSDFADPNGEGAIAVSVFLYGKQDEDVQADVAGFTARLLAFFGENS